MNTTTLPIEPQFEVIKLKLYLEQNPEHSLQLAIENYEDFLALVYEYKKLQKDYKRLQSEFISAITADLV
ncbi:MAG: hypothetical protein AAFR62_01130 [Cyanobacteria bacterium J06629_2]